MRISDWSSVVCSSDLTMEAIAFGTWEHDDPYGEPAAQAARDPVAFRSHLREMLIGGAYATGPAPPHIERFAEFKRDGPLQPDVDPFVGAMLAVSGELAEIGRAHSELQSLMRNSYAVFCFK